jgi:hypothetical protein
LIIMQKKDLNKFPIIVVALFFIAGSVSVPGFAQQSVLHIVSPASSLVVRPGQTVPISVAADSTVEKLVVVGQHPLGMARLVVGGAAGIVAQGQEEARPRQFLLTIPGLIQPGNYRVTAVGTTSGGPVESQVLVLDVERPDEPTRIWAEPSSIQFTRVGDQIPLRVLGAFADGTQNDLTRSSKTRFVSADPSIASVGAQGMVTAVAEGQTSILMSTPSADYSISVRVESAN